MSKKPRIVMRDIGRKIKILEVQDPVITLGLRPTKTGILPPEIKKE